MRIRGWLVLLLGLVLVASTVTVYRLPQIIRHVAVARLHALTGRPVSIDAVELSLLRGQLRVRGIRLAERDGATPFADIDRIDLRVHLPSLVLGRVWIREMVVSDSTVRVVRIGANEFNFSDLIRSSTTRRRPFDLTVDRFALVRGTVTLEDRALPEWRTWISEHIAIEARNVSTSRGDGTATGTSVTAGAPVSVEVKNLRLYPVHLQATVTVQGLDLTPVRMYLPPDVPIRLDRGHMSTSLVVNLDARDGIQADATGRLEDVALLRPEGGEPLALIPAMTIHLAGLGIRERDLKLAQLTVEGTMGVGDPTTKAGSPLRLSSVRASGRDLTWPATTPGRLELLTSIPGGGTLAMAGTLRPPPASTEVRLRLTNLNLEPWARFFPTAARVTGLAEADLRMNEPLAARAPARVQGTVAVKRLAVSDTRHELLRAQRIEASGLQVHWPTRVVVGRVLVTGPRAIVERDRDGKFPLTSVASGMPASSRSPSSPVVGSARPAAGSTLGVDIGEILVRDGALAWRDDTVSPTAQLAISGIEGAVKGGGWPLQGPLRMRVALRPPGGGRLQVTGDVGLDPLAVNLRVGANAAPLAPYEAYLPTVARVSGAADLDLAVVSPSLTERRATVQGTAALSGVDVRDGERTVMRLERATATGLNVNWPDRIAVSHLTLSQPWVLLERDDKGALPLRGLLRPRSGARSEAAAEGTTGTVDSAEATSIAIGQLSIERGGARIVDRVVAPAFAVDFQSVTLRMAGFSSGPAKPARLELTGRLGTAAELGVRGTVRAMGGPLRVDLNGELRDFAVPRTNPYLLRQAGWKSSDGRLSSTFHCHVDGDALAARTDIRLSHLHVVRASAYDGAQARIGLPLGLITSLMKNSWGAINLGFPIGGRLNDPHFDFHEAIWSALRSVAVKAITLPVSWIGRVRFSEDSRIEQIEVDPVAFEPGMDTPTPEGQAQAGKLAAFLEQLPAVKMALTPIVSSRDAEELKRRALQTTIDRVAAEQRLPKEVAAVRLLERRLGDHPAPDTPEAVMSALLEREPTPTAEISQLAARRLDAVRASIKQTGIDPERLVERKLVEREGTDSQIELTLVEGDSPRPSKAHEVLRRLGVPLKTPTTED